LKKWVKKNVYYYLVTTIIKKDLKIKKLMNFRQKQYLLEEVAAIVAAVRDVSGASGSS